MDCGADAGYRIRGAWPAAVRFAPAAGTGSGSALSSAEGQADARPVRDADGAITLTGEF
jgi:hypothetical protein